MRRALYFSALAGIGAMAIALLLTVSVAATTWGEPVVVATDAKRPDVAIDSNGELHLVWADTNNSRIEYRHCATLDACDAIQKLPNLDGNATAPALALDSQNRPLVVWEQVKGKRHTIYLSRRDAGGWTPPTAFSNQPISILPDLAIGADDTPHVVYESVRRKGRAIYHSTQGSSQLPIVRQRVDFEKMPEAEQIANGRNARVDVDSQNHAHVVWNVGARPFGIKYSYQDNTNNFVAPKTIAKRNKDQAPDLSIDRETDWVGVVWETRENDRAAFALIENGAVIFRKKNVEGGFDTVRHPRIAVDCGGKFQIAFQRQKNDRSDWNIYYREFDSSNNTFSNPLRVTDSQRDDAQPALAATTFGALTFMTGRGGTIKVARGELNTLCHGAPTPTPTYTPTVPTSGWQHIPNTDSQIVYSNSWKTIAHNKASDGDYARCEKDGKCRSGASAKLEFAGGTRIEWETAYANPFGKVDVYIDGKPFERIDLCGMNPNSSKPKFAVRTYILSGDASTAHSIEIKFIGHSRCSDARKDYVAIDGFNILR